jgi:hypothetical protein
MSGPGSNGTNMAEQENKRVSKVRVESKRGMVVNKQRFLKVKALKFILSYKGGKESF